MSDVTFVNHKQSLIDLCQRTAWRLAIGDIEYNHDVGIQIEFLYNESNTETRQLLESIFRGTGII